MHVIEVEDLWKVYRDGTEAVRGIDFRVRRGEIFGLLGPNGAGKTTTIRILATLHPPSSGTARVLGYDVVGQARSIKPRIGFAMQEVGMDDLATAMEMIVFHARLHGISRREARHRAKELLETFGLWEQRHRRVIRFSGGLQRRLDLAVSLIHRPELLFLDEPSTGLDPTSRSALWNILLRLQRDEGLSILMSTHYMDEADFLCDRIAVMSQGKIAAIDRAEDLKRSAGLDVVEVALASPPTSEQRRLVDQAFGHRNVDLDATGLRVRVSDGDRSLLPALRHIDRIGLQVSDTKVKRPTLDDAFLKYTGERLEEDEVPAQEVS